MTIFGRGKRTPIGEGVSGKVDLCWKNHQCYVVKTFHSKEKYESRKEYRARVLHEYHVLRGLDHANFIKTWKYSVLLDGLTVRMYMEAGTANLALLLRNALDVQEPEILCLWKQLCNGVNYLHSQGLCHRDLKLENLVMDRNSNTLKILDMATACDCTNGQKAVGMVGSKPYMAPETFLQISYDGKSADIWSVAIILYYLANRKFPWESAVWNDEKYAIFALSGVDKNVEDSSTRLGGLSAVWASFPLQSVELVKQMLVDAEHRICMSDVICDSWLRQVACCGASECGHVHVLH